MMARRTVWVWLLSALVALSLAAPVDASSKSGGKTVHVKEYTKKDGTHVKAHDRKAPEPKGTTSSASSAPARTTGNTSVARSADGRIERSAAAKHTFEVQTGYPHGRPGYIVDHIVPLACGGADAPSNMQWQTVADAKAKDKVERVGCGSRAR